MSVAQTKAARRKILLRYKGGKRHRSVAEAIAAERRASMREANIHKKLKNIKK